MAAVFARRPAPLIPVVDLSYYGNLRQGAKDGLVDRFLKWTFQLPGRPKRQRPLQQQGEWIPVQPRYHLGEHPLAEGGLGIVHLWCCVDDSNHITDRVIVKEVIPGLVNWERRNLWRDGEPGGEPRESMLSNAVWRQLELQNPGDGKFVTECLGYGDMKYPWSYDENGRIRLRDGEFPTLVDIASYKIYLEYCPFGNLWDAIARQRMADEPFHEGFIWMTFEALAKCAVAMARCNIVHGDMATSNILLGDHDPQRFKIWPVPKLADFGASRYLDGAARMRFTGQEEANQQDFASPELARDNLDWEVPHLRVSHKTNVWNVGFIICCLLRMQEVLPEAQWRNTNPINWLRPRNQQLRFGVPGQRELRFPAAFRHPRVQYSIALRRLVRRCMKYDAADRPTPARLLREVQRAMGEHLDDLDTYTGGSTGRISWNKKGRIRGKVTDEWKIGTKVDSVYVV